MDMAVDWLLLGVRKDTSVSAVLGAIDVLARTRVATVRASLARSAILLAGKVVAQLHVPAVFDANWDPPKTKENVETFDIVEKKDELFALAEAAEAKIENYTPGKYLEREDPFESRVRYALCQRFKSFQVIIVVPMMMEYCANLLGDYSNPSVLLLRNRGESCSLPERIESFQSTAEFVDRLLTLPLREMVEGMYQQPEIDFGPDLSYSITADIDKSCPRPDFCRNPVEIEYSTEHSEKIREKVETMTKEFEGKLGKIVAGMVSAGYPRQEDIEVAHRANTALDALTRRLESWYQDADLQVQAITGEAKTIIREEKDVAEEMKSTKQSQVELRTALLNLQQVVPVAVEKLSERVESLEKRVKGHQSTVAEISAKYKYRRPIYILKNEKINDTQITVEVVCMKPYSIPGKVHIVQNGELLREFPLSPNEQSKIALGTFMDFNQASFSVSIRDNQGNLISNEFRLEVADSVSIPRPQNTENTETNYLNSIIYKNTGNIEEIEKTIVDQAQQAGLDLFKRLVCGWENPDPEHANEFLLTFLGKLQDGEEVTKAELRAKGFELR